MDNIQSTVNRSHVARYEKHAVFSSILSGSWNNVACQNAEGYSKFHHSPENVRTEFLYFWPSWPVSATHSLWKNSTCTDIVQLKHDSTVAQESHFCGSEKWRNLHENNTAKYFFCRNNQDGTICEHYSAHNIWKVYLGSIKISWNENSITWQVQRYGLKVVCLQKTSPLYCNAAWTVDKWHEHSLAWVVTNMYIVVIKNYCIDYNFLIWWTYSRPTSLTVVLNKLEYLDWFPGVSCNCNHVLEINPIRKLFVNIS